MINKSQVFLAFIMGTAVGTVSTWYCIKKKYEQLAQEEIDSVKEVFSKRDKEKKEDADAKREYLYILEEQGYVECSDPNHEEGGKDVSIRPYVIAPEQFGEYENYEQISLTYYADQVLADENDNIIEDVDDVVGEESLSHFGEYEDDSVFVRNDSRNCDYEILLDERFYSEVAAYVPH